MMQKKKSAESGSYIKCYYGVSHVALLASKI